MTTITLNGSTYNMACTLRVAYLIQNQNNHKPYTEVLGSIGDMTLEQQLDILYASFSVANKEASSSISKEAFREALMNDESFNAFSLMNMLEEIVAGIYGKTVEELHALAESPATSEGDAKNV